jgi:hypothetical protein
LKEGLPAPKYLTGGNGYMAMYFSNVGSERRSVNETMGINVRENLQKGSGMAELFGSVQVRMVIEQVK